ncbi:MAG TPA: mannosyltransferase family protein, partial [Actinomycetota bacterium]
MRTEDQAAATGAEPAAERDRIRRGIRYCLLVFLGVRVTLTIVALVGTALLPSQEPVGPQGWEGSPLVGGWHNLVTSFERFDALWFLRVADQGYFDGDGSAVFFPGYPLLIRGVSFLLGDRPLAAGLLVSNLAFAGALVVLYFLTSAEWGQRVARRSVLYLAIFPTAFFFLAPYSESPFLLFALLAFWGARRGRWAVAGLAGAAAAA